MNFVVFKKIVSDMNLEECMLVNGDIGGNINIMSTKLTDLDNNFFEFEISYKKIDREVLKQLTKDFIDEILASSGKNLTENKKVPAKIKREAASKSSALLFNQAIVLNKKFTFYSCDDFLVVPKFSGKPIVEEEFLVPLFIKESKVEIALQNLVKADILKLGASSAQNITTNDKVIKAVVYDYEQLGPVFAGKFELYTEGGVQVKATIKLDPRFEIAGKLEEVVHFIPTVLKEIS